MVSNLFLLIYTASDYAFCNNTMLYRKNKEEFQKALIWTVLIGLALSFNLLTNLLGIVSIVSYLAITLLLTWLKTRSDKASWYVANELINLGVALAFTIPLAGFIGSSSYLRAPFVNYLLGLTVAAVFFTDIFRRFGYIPDESGDSDGSFERILLFIFIMALQWQYLLITIVGMLVYRWIRYRKPSKMWFVSPAIGIAFSFLWLLIMKAGLI